MARGRWLRLAEAASSLLDDLLPVSCVGCRRGVSPEGAPLCSLCRSRLPRLPDPRCARCAEPLGTLPGPGSGFNRCGTCEEWPLALLAADAPYAFQALASSVVRGLKYRGWRSLAPLMARSMEPVVRSLGRSFGASEGELPLLVPVPLTRARLRERGFNQARDIAASLAELGLGDVDPVLRREPGGRQQARVRAALRRVNVQGRFRAHEASAAPDRMTVIVDDVLTTGSTAIACAEALAEAGFRRIVAVTFARTLRPLDAGVAVRPAFERERRNEERT